MSLTMTKSGTSLALPLPLKLEPARLRAELFALKSRFRAYENPLNIGPALVLPITAPGGRQSGFLDHYPGLSPFLPTIDLKRSKWLRLALDQLPCPKFSVRLIELPPGSGLRPHRDNWRNFRYGILRLHIPLQTNRQAWIRIGDMRMHWPAGTYWYGDFSKEHEVRNEGHSSRTHLVADVGITEDLLRLFPRSFVASQRRKGISLHQPSLSLGDSELERFRCTFESPTGFLPLRQTGTHSGPARIERDKGGGLALELAGRPVLRLIPVAPNRLWIQGAGAGNYIEFPARPKPRMRIELCLKGAVYQHPVTGRFEIGDFHRIVPAIRAEA